MFTSNPWGAYFAVLTPLLAAYYLFVGLRFYGRDIKARISPKRSFGSRPKSPPPQNFDAPDPPIDTLAVPALPLQTNLMRPEHFAEDEASQPFSWQPDEQFHELASHLREAIKEACEKDYGKQELILLLQMTLKEYPVMGEKRFRTAIDNLIAAECSKYGAIQLHEQDLAAVWSQAL